MPKVLYGAVLATLVAGPASFCGCSMSSPGSPPAHAHMPASTAPPDAVTNDDGTVTYTVDPEHPLAKEADAIRRAARETAGTSAKPQDP